MLIGDRLTKLVLLVFYWADIVKFPTLEAKFKFYFLFFTTIFFKSFKFISSHPLPSNNYSRLPSFDCIELSKEQCSTDIFNKFSLID